jgi:TonB family protein
MAFVARNRALLAVAWLLGALAGIAMADNDDSDVPRVTHFEDTDSDRAPLVTAVPQYPPKARRDRIEGEATVCFLIDADGHIVRPAVRRTSHRMFAKPSLKAIRKSSYDPLRPDQRLSQVKTCRTFRFLLTPVAIESVE